MKEDKKENVLECLRKEYYTSDASTSIKILLESTLTEFAHWNPVISVWSKMTKRKQAEVLIEFINWADKEDAYKNEWRYE